MESPTTSWIVIADRGSFETVTVVTGWGVRPWRFRMP